MPCCIKQPTHPPNLSEGEIWLLKAKIRTSTPFELYNCLSAINDVYVREGISQCAVKILGIVGFCGYYIRYLPGDDEDYHEQDDAIDTHLHKKMYVYKIWIRNTKNKIRPNVGCYTPYVSPDKRVKIQNIARVNPSM